MPLIQVALNGRRTRAEHPAVPLTPAELAREGAAAVRAGARSIHFHPRDAEGQETLQAEPRAASLAALRTACPGIELTVTTGVWIEGDPERRLSLVRAWTVLPDTASVNLKEPGAIALIDLLLERGIGVEAGVAVAADAEALVASGRVPRCARVLLEPEGEAARAVAEADAIDRVLDRAGLSIRRLHHGYELATWAVIDRAIRLGHDVRIGLEDTLVLPDGRATAGNADLVAACAMRVKSDH